MRRALAIAQALYGRAFGEYVTYRGEMVIWVVAGTVPLLVMFVWMELAEQGPIGGYDARAFAVYFLLAFFMRHMTPFVPIRDLDRVIRLGELSARLLKPIDPYWQFAVDQSMDMLYRLPVVVPMVLVGFWLADAWSVVPADRLPWFVLAAALGAVVHFHLHYAIGLLAFWTDRIVGTEGIVFVAYFGLGGGLAPVSILPGWVQAVMDATPFPYIIGFPVTLLTEAMTPAQMAQGLAVQAAWAAGLGLLARVLWLRGLRRYEATGA